MNSMVIDCHSQAGSGETWAESGVTRWVDYKIEMLLERAAEAGIDRTCIMAPQNATYAEKNREVAKLCEKYPGKLLGFAVHSPQRETGRLRPMLLEEVRSMGLKAVKSDGHPTRELLDVVAELKIPVMYYPENRNEVRATSERAERAYLDSSDRSTEPPAAAYHMMATIYSSVRFILPHLGSYRSDTWWAHIDAIDLARRYPEKPIFVTFSGDKHFEDECKAYIEPLGVASFTYIEQPFEVLSILSRCVQAMNRPR